VTDAFDFPVPLVELDEQRLLACARSGDSAAFESLVMPHRDAILRLARRILRNQEDAEDVVQIALLEAFRHLNAFEGRSRFSSWLHRIATNAALMRLRASRHKYEMSLDQIIEGDDRPAQFHVVEPRPNPEQECSAKEVRAVLGEAIDRAIGLKPKGHDFIIDRRHNRPSVSRHMSVTGG